MRQQASLAAFCKRIGFETFNSYMEKNWHTYTDMWAMFKRDKLPHFRNHANNRLESFFGKLKDRFTSDSIMSYCLSAIFAAEWRR